MNVDESWICTDYGFEHSFFGVVDDVFGSGVVNPLLLVLLWGRGDAVELHVLVLCGVVVELVYPADGALVGFCQVGGDEQENVAFVGDDVGGDVIAVVFDIQVDEFLLDVFYGFASCLDICPLSALCSPCVALRFSFPTSSFLRALLPACFMSIPLWLR